MDIPYVVNQWWASICAAKQRAPHYLALLRERGYPDYVEQYSAISLGSTLEDDPEQAPWGGLPEVTVFLTQVWTDAHLGIAEAWERERGVPFFALEKARRRTGFPSAGGSGSPRDWEEVVGTARLDLMSAELERLVAFLEVADRASASTRRGSSGCSSSRTSSRSGAGARATCSRPRRPAPLDIVDSIPAVMLPAVAPRHRVGARRRPRRSTRRSRASSPTARRSARTSGCA